ncbi:Gag polyprotein [Bienertia sinuspersici]
MTATLDIGTVPVMRDEGCSKEKEEERQLTRLDDDTDEQNDEQINWVDDGGDDDARLELGFVGKIWKNRNINISSFINTIKNVWQTTHGVDISNIDKNMFPWNFDRHALLLEEIGDSEKPSDVNLYYLPIWARVYNLPFKGRFNSTNVESVGNKIGTFVKVDKSGSMGINKSIGLKVIIDVRKPLVQKAKIKMRDGKEDFFEVKYEKPPLFCFFCGKLGHGTKDCRDYKEEDDPTLKYGLWIKASPWKTLAPSMPKESNGGHSSCAKNLFVTKPKRREDESAKRQVVEILNQLEGCMIRDEAGTQHVNKGGINPPTQYENAGNDTTCNEYATKENQKQESFVAPITFSVGSHSNNGGLAKKWKRLNHPQPTKLRSGNNLSGNKREEREVDANGNEPMEIEFPGEGRKRSGGMALLWNTTMMINIQTYSLNHIDVNVENNTQGRWRFTGIYGFPEDKNKQKTGQMLNNLKGGLDIPWLCGGDFNLMLISSEKQGGSTFNP